MRVLLIHRDLGIGSVGRIVEDLYFGIVNNGIECKVAYGGCINKTNIPVQDIVAINNKNGIRFHALMSRLTDRTGFFGSRHTKKLIHFIESYSPDIIHIHGCYGYWINIKVLYRYLATKNIRVINTLHSCWDFTGHCCYFTKANCDKWKTQCKACPERRNYPSSLFFDNSALNYKHKKCLFASNDHLEYVAPSEWIKTCFHESFLKNHKITLINNGIDLFSFKKNNGDVSKYGIKEKSIVVLGVAACWNERKGLSDFIDLARIVPNNYQIVVVGVNDDQLKKLPNNIVGIKRTDSKDDLASLYSRATVFFNPTYEDNYPTVNLEAIACGTPVVTYPTGGSPEIIEKTKCGIVVDYKDYKSIITFIETRRGQRFLLSDEQLQSFSREKMVEKYLELYLNKTL